MFIKPDTEDLLWYRNKALRIDFQGCIWPKYKHKCDMLEHKAKNEKVVPASNGFENLEDVHKKRKIL